MEDNYGPIDYDDFSFHGYYIIKYFLSTYNLQSDLSIYGQNISSSEMVREGTYFFQSILILTIMFYKELNPLTNLFL